MEELQSEKKIVTLTEVKPTQDGYRWVAITAMLLAIGIILHTVNGDASGHRHYSAHGKPQRWRRYAELDDCNVFHCHQSYQPVAAAGTGFPLGNLASEVCGAIVCCLLVKAMLSVKLDKWKLRPFITGFAATIMSGGVFTFILKIVMGLPLSVWMYAMLPVVTVIGVLNGSITFLLYGPVRRLFFVQEEDN